MQRVGNESPAVVERLRKQAHALGSGDARPLVVTGDADHGILRAVATTAADLVVMGVAPRTWADEVIFGSTLRVVLRRVRVPILVVPALPGAEDRMRQGFHNVTSVAV